MPFPGVRTRDAAALGWRVASQITLLSCLSIWAASPLLPVAVADGLARLDGAWLAPFVVLLIWFDHKWRGAAGPNEASKWLVRQWFPGARGVAAETIATLALLAALALIAHALVVEDVASFFEQMGSRSRWELVGAIALISLFQDLREWLVRRSARREHAAASGVGDSADVR